VIPHVPRFDRTHGAHTGRTGEQAQGETVKHLFISGLMLAFISTQGTAMKKNAPTIIKQEITADWRFREAASGEWHTATVPGCVHTDLLQNKLIPDPFYRTNEADLQWIGEKDWVYQTVFRVSEDMLAHQNVELVFHGLDTYAKVYVNDSLFLSADNMFREWRADAKPILRHGENKITIFFRNVFDETTPKYKTAPYELQAFSNNDQGDPRVAMYSRKAQFHYGWDWGPRLVTCGIWKPVILEAWDSFKINGVQIIQQDVSKAEAAIISKLEILSTGEQHVSITVTADSIKLGYAELSLKDGVNAISLEGKITKPKLWWSNGLGEQYLYKYKVAVAGDLATADEYTAELGVRSLKIIREKDSAGTSMYVLLNGVPVFMKGANYIPLDNFQSRVTREHHESIVTSAAEAHMNMLRVWGGGIFEDDSFYKMCDKYGILIWHDMLFACAMYPGDDTFLCSVKHEIIDNVKRIRNHCSIALYCGNNENEIGWEQWGWKEKYAPTVQALCETNLKKLYYETIPAALKEADSTRYYHASSPIAGFDHRSNGDGDIHYWGVWHGKDPFEKFEDNIARFVSEYGFQSYPELESIVKFTEPADRELNSAVMLSHQRCMADERKDKQYGNRLIKTYMDRCYREPKDFPSYLYTSQVLQALGVQMAVEAHRRHMPYCMGSLYWQIDDCWPVASWSSIDYYGKWKALHYMAKRVYESVIIAPKITGDSVEIYIVSDELEKIRGDLYVYVREFCGKIKYVNTFPISVMPNTSRIYLTLSKKELLGGASDDRVVLISRLVCGKHLAPENFTYFRYPKDLQLEPPTFKIRAKKVKRGFEISLTASTLAKNVRLSCDQVEGFFTDNYFDLLPNEVHKLTFETSAKIKDIETMIKAVSLVDMY
jgi:beta-mannosidase